MVGRRDRATEERKDRGGGTIGGGAQNHMMRTEARGLQTFICKIKQNCCLCMQAIPIS